LYCGFSVCEKISNSNTPAYKYPSLPDQVGFG